MYTLSTFDVVTTCVLALIDAGFFAIIIREQIAPERARKTATVAIR